MTRRRPERGRVWVVIGLSLSLTAVGCPDDEDEAACTVVHVFGPETGDEKQSLEDAFVPLEERLDEDDSCLTVEVTGDASFEESVRRQIESDNPPDIVMFPQPGYVGDFADRIVALPNDLAMAIEENFDAPWTEFVRDQDGRLVAVPIKADLKSLVWYSPRQFEEHGYEVPQTQDQFFELIVQMANDGNPPFCLGLEKDASTGWPLTDWIEDHLLRSLPGDPSQRLDLYDRWARHEVRFDHPEVVEVAGQVHALLSREGVVLDGLEGSISRSYIDAGRQVLDGGCMTYRMGNFYAALWPENTMIGEDVDFFRLPGPRDQPALTLSGGMYATAFSDDPLVMKTMRYLASVEFAERRAANRIGGFLSPNRQVRSGEYRRTVDRDFAALLTEATEAGAVRFDASDQMPGAVGAGSFWQAAVDIARGAQTVEEAFAEIERTWPGD